MDHASARDSMREETSPEGERHLTFAENRISPGFSIRTAPRTDATREEKGVNHGIGEEAIPPLQRCAVAETAVWLSRVGKPVPQETRRNSQIPVGNPVWWRY